MHINQLDRTQPGKTMVNETLWIEESVELNISHKERNNIKNPNLERERERERGRQRHGESLVGQVLNFPHY